MRPLIFVRAPEPTNLDQFAPDVQCVRDAFDRYLDSYPVKTARTKTSLMGPVGKILSEVRTGKWDSESLAGYALNIHLMNPKAHGYIAPAAWQALQEGVRGLIALTGDVPPAAQDRLIDRIDYGLYWVRRRKGLEFMEQVRGEFSEFLRRRYGEVAKVNDAWSLPRGKQLRDLAEVGFPGRSGKRYREAADSYRADVATFWEERGEAPDEEEEEGE